MADDRIAKALIGQPQPTPGEAVWNYIRNSAPSQLGAAGHLAQSVAQPFTNLFGNGGQEFWNGPQDPQAAHDMSNALMTMYAGSASPAAAEMNPAALNAGIWGRIKSAVGAGPEPMRLYHGTAGSFDKFSPPEVWASPSPVTADKYASLAADKTGEAPNILPLDLHSNKIMQPTKRYADADAMRRKALAEGYDAINWGPFEAGGGDYVQIVRPGTVKSPLTGETLFSGSDKAPNPVAAAMMAESQPQNAMTGIKAFHGSPYDFDKFDASHIGTGEGAQAYGHGLYFAENPEVAGSYKQPGAAQWKTLDVPQHPPGKMYEVNINADPSLFLDWDKLIHEQPSPVQKYFAGKEPPSGQEWRGSDLIGGRPPGSGSAIESELSQAGIPGIRYLDQGSRVTPDIIASLERQVARNRANNSPELDASLRVLQKARDQQASGVTHNYVVFPGNEHLIEILKKYGLVPGMVGAGLAGMGGQQDQTQ